MNRGLALILDRSLLRQQVQGFLRLELFCVLLDFVVDALAILNHQRSVLELAHAYCPAICRRHHSTLSHTGFIIDFIAVVGLSLEMVYILINIHAFGSFIILEEFLCMTTYLRTGPSLDMPFNFFPVFAV